METIENKTISKVLWGGIALCGLALMLCGCEQAHKSESGSPSKPTFKALDGNCYQLWYGNNNMFDQVPCPAEARAAPRAVMFGFGHE